MELIGTHNSGTGEPSQKWYHKLLIPFARCQSKTIKEQREVGCGYFDLRVYRESDGNYRICHGLWRSKKSLDTILIELSEGSSVKAYTQVTLENKDINDTDKVVEEIEELVNTYGRGIVHLTQVNHKSKNGWSVLRYYIPCPAVIQGFLPLDGHSWHTYFPIPWLWKKIYHNTPSWDIGYYTLVDFL